MYTEGFNIIAERMIQILKDFNDQHSFNICQESKVNVESKILEINYLLDLLAQKIKIPKFEVSLLNKEMFEQPIELNSQYFKPIDYQFGFLIFLFLNYEKFKNKDLRHHIDAFINIIQYQFRFGDIVRTTTGATRCKTNIRFAVMRLREIGLINYTNRENKRIWTPTIIGFFISCYAILNEVKDTNHFEKEMSERSSNFLIDNKIVKIINKLNSPEVFRDLLAKLEIENFRLDSISKFESVLKKYNSFLRISLASYENKKMSKNEFRKLFKEEIDKIEENNDLEKLKVELIDKTKSEMVMEKVYEILQTK